MVPVSISSGVIVASFGDRDWNGWEASDGWILDARGVRKTLLALCCIKRAFGYA